MYLSGGYVDVYCIGRVSAVSKQYIHCNLCMPHGGKSAQETEPRRIFPQTEAGKSSEATLDQNLSHFVIRRHSVLAKSDIQRKEHTQKPPLIFIGQIERLPKNMI